MNKYVPAIVLVLVVIYIANSPDQAAAMADNVGDFLSKMAHGLGRFFDKLA